MDWCDGAIRTQHAFDHSGHRTIGKISYRMGSGDTVELFEIEVVNSERRTGEGRRLLAMMFNDIGPGKKVWALTRSTNRIAHQFYEGCGFRVIAPLYDFYSETGNIDAIMYGRVS